LQLNLLHFTGLSCRHWMAGASLQATPVDCRGRICSASGFVKFFAAAV
jgi:hypothetical protein